MAKKKPATIAKQFADIRADYEMTRNTRFVRKRRGVAARGSGADYHFRTETDYYDSIEQARDMDRNDAVIGILADRRVDNIVQGGFKLDPKTGDKALDLDLWQRWQAFTQDPDSCDICGELTWQEIERACCRAECIDGDIVVIGTDEGSFQVVEAHLIQTKGRQADTFLGVTTNEYGKRLQYHVMEEKNEFGTFGDSTPIDVRDTDGRRQVFHVYDPTRISATRGVTKLHAIFAYAGMLEDINFAKLVQQQAASCYAILHEYSSQPALPNLKGYGETTTEQTATGDTRTIDGIGPGMEYFGQQGEKLTGFSPNIPNSEYFQQVRLILQILGVNFGLPLCLVLMDGSETNFSGWRGAVDEARKGFVADQQNLVRRLHRPAYEWWLSREMDEDAALQRAAQQARINIYAHNWNLPTWSYIEPVADAEGDAVQLRNALTSPRRLHAARGNDWEELSEEIVDDNLYAITNASAKAAEFNAANPTAPPITWRDLIALPMPEGQTLALQDPTVVAKQETGEQAASAEMLGVGRRDWMNSRKAINDILGELGSGAISEQRARLDLDALGVPPAKIDAYILDAADGNIDAPELADAELEVASA